MNAPTTQPVSAWLGEFLLLSALWGASFLFMRLGASEFGPLPTAGLRVLLATLFLWPILLQQGQWPALRKHWKPALLSGVVNSAIPFALYSWAVLHITTGLASILNATVPLFGALVAWAWLGDRINRLRWLGLGIGFVGVALLAWRAPGGAGIQSDDAPWAIAACLGPPPAMPLPPALPGATWRECRRWLRPRAASWAQRWVCSHPCCGSGPLPCRGHAPGRPSWPLPSCAQALPTSFTFA